MTPHQLSTLWRMWASTRSHGPQTLYVDCDSETNACPLKPVTFQSSGPFQGYIHTLGNSTDKFYLETEDDKNYVVRPLIL
jgi:hypothetical protein